MREQHSSSQQLLRPLSSVGRLRRWVESIGGRLGATTRRQRLRRNLVCLGSAIGLVTPALIAATASPVTAYIVCGSGVNNFVWDGSSNDPAGKVGDNKDWDNPYNWDVNCTPGLLDQPYDDVVTIPRRVNGVDVSVFLYDGASANVAALFNRGALTVTTGAWLVTLGNSESKTLTLKGALGGRGVFKVTSTLRWTSTTAGAATQTTRRCPPEGCSAPVSGPLGRTVIAKGATMSVSGRGVNLSDQRIIDNHGTVTLSNGGYIAADDGTAFRNVRDANSTGRFLIKNDLGYYQGYTAADLGWNVGLSKFTNTGSVIKVAGDGVSLIAGEFSYTDPNSPYTGRVEVHSGTLSIQTPSGTTTRTATVRGGSTFGNGGPVRACDPLDPSSCSAATPVTATATDSQVTTVEVTKQVTASTPVTIKELAPAAGSRGLPVRIETPNVSAVADPTAPLRFRIVLDASRLKSGDTSVSVARNAPVYRDEAPLPLPKCGTSQNPTAAQKTCVARTKSENETRALPNCNPTGTTNRCDVVMVISSLQNSRYRVG